MTTFFEQAPRRPRPRRAHLVKRIRRPPLLAAGAMRSAYPPRRARLLHLAHVGRGGRAVVCWKSVKSFIGTIVPRTSGDTRRWPRARCGAGSGPARRCASAQRLASIARRRRRAPVARSCDNEPVARSPGLLQAGAWPGRRPLQAFRRSCQLRRGRALRDAIDVGRARTGLGVFPVRGASPSSSPCSASRGMFANGRAGPAWPSPALMRTRAVH